MTANLFSQHDAQAEIDGYRAKIAALQADLERERMRLAACGVVALANTPESAAAARDMHQDYRSVSCDDVARAVDREMALRAEVEGLTTMLDTLVEHQDIAPHERCTCRFCETLIANNRLRADIARLTSQLAEVTKERDVWASKAIDARLAGHSLPLVEKERDTLRTKLTVADELVSALDRCESNRGRFSCVPNHDCRCEKDRGISDECTCGADELEEAVRCYRTAREGTR